MYLIGEKEISHFKTPSAHSPSAWYVYVNVGHFNPEKALSDRCAIKRPSNNESESFHFLCLDF